MPIQPGAIVKCRQTADRLWVAKCKDPDQRWRIVSKDTAGGSMRAYTERVAGEGDLTEVAPPQAYEVGGVVEYDGIKLTIVADLGEAIEVEVPASAFPLKGKGQLLIPAGNGIILNKSDLALEKLE